MVCGGGCAEIGAGNVGSGFVVRVGIGVGMGVGVRDEVGVGDSLAVGNGVEVLVAPRRAVRSPLPYSKRFPT